MSLPISPAARRLFEAAEQLAKNESAPYVSSEHVLRAAMVADSGAKRLLGKFGIPLTDLEQTAAKQAQNCLARAKGAPDSG